MKKNNLKIHWFVDVEESKWYDKTVWFRCGGIGNYVNLIEKGHVIVGVKFDNNNIGFIIDEKGGNKK